MFSASKTKQAVSGAYTLTKSLRFRSSASAYLNRTPSSSGSQTTFTLSTWVKRGVVNGSTRNIIFSSGSSTTMAVDIYYQQGTYVDTIWIEQWNGTQNYIVQTTAIYRDPSAWYHVVVALDTTQATASNRLKIYVNGSQNAVTASYPTQNFAYPINTSSYSAKIGLGTQFSTTYFDGYQTDVYLIDGQQLTPSSFGATNATTGVWQPIAYTGTYGTNGFHLTFANATSTTTLGYDTSGNSNNWTTNNISLTAGSTYDSMNDVPTLTSTTASNYAVLNPLAINSSTTLTNGNLDYSSPASAPAPAYSSIGMTSGKWYFESTITATNTFIGVWGNGNAGMLTIYPTYYWDIGASSATSLTLEKTSGSASGTLGSLAANDVYAVALDIDNTTIYFYKNNSLIQTITGMSFVGSLFFVIGSWASSSASSTSVNFGQRPFAYTTPSGFKALNTYNLPTPTIGATSTTQAGKFFNPVLYTGNSGVNVVSGMGFQPDMLWQKDRTSTGNNVIDDAVRGINKVLITNLTLDEITGTTYLTSFDSDGFSMNTASPAFNFTGRSYVAWGWKANGSGSTNTAGSITSTVSANTTSGFSIVTYTGTGTAGTIGHGLGVAPSMIIVKSRSAMGDWPVYHSSVGNGSYTKLNTNAASASSSTVWNATSPTSSVFSVGINTDSNTVTVTYVAYCFAQIDGFSAFGKYTGNGSTDGPFVYLGFKPKFVMIKSSTNAYGWIMLDSSRNTYNPENLYLYAQLSDAEGTYTIADFLSNGFKIRAGTGTATNNNGDTFIYAAFAENPFKYSLAR